MDLQLTDDEQLIRDSAARFILDYPRRKPGASGFDRDLWSSMAEMGWLAAGVPAEFGGLGGSVETALIAEELGRGSVGGDYLGAGVLAPQLLIASGDRQRIDDLLPGVLSGQVIIAAAYSEPNARGNPALVASRAYRTGDGYALSGTKSLVLAGDAADWLIVSAYADGDDDGRVSLFLIAASETGVTIVPTPLVDGSSAATIHLRETPGQLLGSAGQAGEALVAMVERGIIAIAAESVGMMEAVVNITADYFRTRTQFGSPLGAFQVLQHKLADMTIDAEMSRASLLVALAAFELDDFELRARRFSGAKANVGEALRRVTGSGVQAHGGMGMTQEYPVGRYLQRMTVLDAALGSPAYHMGVCAKSLAAAQ